MKYFVLLLILIGFTGTAFGQYLGDKLPPNTMMDDPETGKLVLPPSYVDFYYSNSKFEKYSVISDNYSYGMTKGLIFPKDEQEGLDFVKGFLEKIGYTLDGTEWIDKVNFGNRIEITIQQKIHGWIIPNHITRFEFTKDNTEIILGRWYDNVTQYEFKLSQDDAKKISKEFMDTEVKSRPTLQKYDYSFESIQDDGVRVIIFDDKPFYMVPITYKANADMQYQTGHCGSNQFLTIYVMVEGKTGTAIGWNYPGCE